MTEKAQRVEDAGPGTEDEAEDLSHPWKQVQSAVWLIGIAILAWQGWWWPGILVLVAISGLTEAALRQFAVRKGAQAEAAQRAALDTEAMARTRAAVTPEQCANCGSPLRVDTVVWSGRATGKCPYCGSTVTPGKASST